MFSPTIRQQVASYQDRRFARHLPGWQVWLCGLLTAGLFSRIHREALLAEACVNSLVVELVQQGLSDALDEYQEGLHSEPMVSEDVDFAAAELDIRHWSREFRTITGVYFIHDAELRQMYDMGLSPTEAARIYKEKIERQRHREQQIRADD